MKKKILRVAALLLTVIATNLFAQVDYSKPKEVAQAFLDLCLAGKLFEACKLYGTEGCSDQMEILVKKLVTNDVSLVNDKCQYIVDSCMIDQKKNTAKCYYMKSCKDAKMSKKGFLTVKKIEDEWRVEYLWKRDKYI
ncbi:MAG: hypothetical protein WCZ90_17125 [Melioribacteraceae bacterium]